MNMVIGFGVAVVLLVGLVLLLPFIVDLNRYQDQYRPLIEDALNRKVQLQDIRLTIWPRIGARVAGFAVMDDPAFSPGPFTSIASLDVGVKLMPLLGGKVEVEEITLRDPVITVVKNKNGVLNVSTIGAQTPSPTAAPQPEMPRQPTGDPLQVLALFAVDRVSITGGNLTYRDLSTPSPTEYQLHNLQLSLASVHLGESPTIHLGATVQPFNLPVAIDGQIGPLTETLDVKQFDFTFGLGKVAVLLKGSFVGGNLDTTVSSPSIKTADLPISLPLAKPVEIKDLLLAAKATYPLKSGVSPLELADVPDLRLGIVMGDSAIALKGSLLGGQATVAVSAPSVNTAELPIKLPLAKSVEVKNLQLTADMKGQDARLTNLSFTLFNGTAKAQAALGLGAVAPPFSGTVSLQGLQIGPALEALGSTGLSVSGTAKADLSVKGQGFSMPELSRAFEGTSHVGVKDGKIEGVNLMQQAVTLLNIAGISLDNAKATAFSTIETDLAIKQGIINVQRLLIDGHDFQATGGGTIGFNQTLNLTVNLNLSQELSQKIAGSSPVVKLALNDGRLSLPLIITGTAQAPSFGLDMKGMTGKVQEQVQKKVEEAVGGLLKGTTKPQDLKQQGQDLLKGLLGR